MTAVAARPISTPRGVSAATRLGVVRVVVFALWLVIVVGDPLGYLAELPPAHPVGVFRWVPDGLVPAAGFKVALVALLVACLVGVPGFVVLGACAAALLTVHQAVLREFTFVNHEELALLVCTWVLVLFPAAGAVSWPRRRRAPSPASDGALFALSAMLLLPYALIAAHRLAFAAPEVFTGGSLPYWLASLSALDRDGWGVGLWALGHPELVVLLKAGFVVTTVFELLAPLCLVSPRFARVWVVVVVGFHVVNEFTLNLFFWQNAVLVVLLIGWPAFCRSNVKKLTPPPMKPCSAPDPFPEDP